MYVQILGEHTKVIAKESYLQCVSTEYSCSKLLQTIYWKTASPFLAQIIPKLKRIHALLL